MRCYCFNSRTSCEVRRAAHLAPASESSFNSRTSCEVRHMYNITDDIFCRFNSRASCEVRRHTFAPLRGARAFQLTHLLRGAAEAVAEVSKYAAVSTHAPLARCGMSKCIIADASSCFNSRTSCEVRRLHASAFLAQRMFQLTHLLRGAAR